MDFNDTGQRVFQPNSGIGVVDERADVMRQKHTIPMSRPFENLRIRCLIAFRILHADDIER